MRRLWRVYRATATACVIRELEFRANFLTKLIQSIGWVVFYLIVIEVIYQNVPQVAGWDRAMGLVLGGTVLINAGIVGVLFISLHDVADQVRRGTLDFVLTRPVDTQFGVALRRVELSRLGVLASGFVMLAYGVSRLGRVPSGLDWASYAVSLAGGTAVYFSLIMFLSTLAIYFVRTDNIWVIGEIVVDAARYPVDVFPILFRQLFTFGLPVAMLSTVPALALTKGASVGWVALCAGWGVGSVALTRYFWLRSLRVYSSASS